MELEEEWWKGQVVADIHQALRIKELRLPPYKSNSPQLNTRRYFADLLAIISNHFHLCPTARHLAVYLLDLFMDRYDISIQHLHLVALSCLLLATFQSKGTIPEVFWKVPAILGISVSSVSIFFPYTVCLFAAACIAASRAVLKLFPLWPVRLHRITAYAWDALLPCIERLLIAHDNDVKEANKQKGEQKGEPRNEQSIQQIGQTTFFTRPLACSKTRTEQQTSPCQYPMPSHLLQCSHLQCLHQQQSSQSGQATRYAIPACPSNLQINHATHGSIQANAMTLATTIEGKSCINIPYSRSYPVNGH
ncbi:hypothetical protein scyTo_0007741 [Scyliorhinus torazame]|uniref:Cyclin-like domain-containing protein n=1 Tax=Scyliorhinus torazame TaxID=75743 RepID=A0A401NXC9_SCYTO|nr:hypothetical protein [Scyliorhinus torazame]